MSFQLELSCIQVGIEFGLFEELEKNPMSITEVGKKLNLKASFRNIEDWLNKLYISNHLKREDNQDRFLRKYSLNNNNFIKSNPYNIIGVLSHNSTLITERLKNLKYSLQENRVKNDSGNPFEIYYGDEEKTKMFLTSMSKFQMLRFDAIVAKFDFSKYKSLVDIGGCLGDLCVKVKKTNSHLDCINFDLKHVEKFY